MIYTDGLMIPIIIGRAGQARQLQHDRARPGREVLAGRSYVYVCVCMCVHVYCYVCKKRIHTCISIYIHIYIYNYILFPGPDTCRGSQPHAPRPLILRSALDFEARRTKVRVSNPRAMARLGLRMLHTQIHRLRAWPIHFSRF